MATFPDSSSNNVGSISYCPQYALDVAVMSQQFSSVHVLACDSVHDVFLDPIPVTLRQFRDMFYSTGHTFSLTKLVEEHPCFNPKISFLPLHRSYNNGEPFNLLEVIVSNAEIDLNVPRTCFTTASLLEVQHQLGNINTLFDIEGGDCDCHHHEEHHDNHDKHHHHHDKHHHHRHNHHVLCALLWEDIVQILRNQWVQTFGAATATNNIDCLYPVADDISEYFAPRVCDGSGNSQDSSGNATATATGISYTLVITVLFKSCDPNLLPTAVRFRYLIHASNYAALQ